MGLARPDGPRLGVFERTGPENGRRCSPKEANEEEREEGREEGRKGKNKKRGRRSSVAGGGGWFQESSANLGVGHENRGAAVCVASPAGDVSVAGGGGGRKWHCGEHWANGDGFGRIGLECNCHFLL